MKHTFLALSLLSSLVLTGCSDGPSSENYTGGRSGEQTGQLTISITDAAIDNIDQVWIQFDAIEIKPAEGPSITYSFDTPLDIDLLSLQGSLSKDFFNNIAVPSGSYNWIRLAVNTSDSYIRTSSDGGVHALIMPGASRSGLKINNGFSVGAGSQVAMTIDFDLRKSIVTANGQYYLKPVLRLVNNAEVGTLTGNIDPALTLAANCSDNNSVTGNAVYVFAGFDAVLDDIDNQLPEPVTTALVTSTYEYEVGFLPQGDYTVAYTCMADLDDPENDDVIEFQSVTNITVSVPVELSGANINR